MRVYLDTEKGIDKPGSEDRVLVGDQIYIEQYAETNLAAGPVVVADGVGGNNGGAVAAYQVCKGLVQMKDADPTLFARINDELLEMGNSSERLKDMATTVSGIYFSPDDNNFIFHVGNTRVYAIQAAMYLRQLTRDDTVVEYLVQTGKLSEEDALNYPARNEITACFGGGKASLLKMKVLPIDTSEYTMFLLTCDGIHETLTIDEIEDIIGEADGDWGTVVKMLVRSAKHKGSTDDCTALIIDCEEAADGLEI